MLMDPDTWLFSEHELEKRQFGYCKMYNESVEIVCAKEKTRIMIECKKQGKGNFICTDNGKRAFKMCKERHTIPNC